MKAAARIASGVCLGLLWCDLEAGDTLSGVVT